MGLYEDFLIYRDKHGLNQLTTNGTEGDVSQNGALFTMEYLLCLLSYIYDDNGKLNPEMFRTAQQEIQRLKQVYASLENKPGQTVRYPGSTETDSMDNDNANLMFSMLFGERAFAQRHQAAGKDVKCESIEDGQNRWLYLLCKVVSTFQLAGFFSAKNFWNNQEPTRWNLNSWFGRSPGHMGMIDVAATGSTTWFRGIGLWVGQLLAIFAKPGTTDPWKLSYVAWYYLKERGWIWRLGYAIWKHKLLKMYPNGMRDVYSIYYQDPNHPIRKYAKPYF